MTDKMPRPRPLYLQPHRTAAGKTLWYFRVGKGPRIRIHGEYGSPAFMEAYHAARAGLPVPHPKVASGSLEWLIERYRETARWQKDLSPATRRQRDNIFAGVIKQSGSTRYTEIDRAVILRSREKREKTPAQARNFLDAMRGLFRWALDAGHITKDPTAGVDNPKRKPGKGFEAWNEADVAAYEECWAIGTKERVWLDVLLYTGLRRGDAVRLGWQHIRDGVAILKTEKSGGRVIVSLPVLPVLARTLEAGPTGNMSLICGERGLPLTKESFGNLFREAARTAGVNKSAHGVRKIAATRAANNGATVAELEAIFGWIGGGMASLYTREADRRRLAQNAIEKMNKPGTPNPKTEDSVWGSEQKAK